MKRCMNCMSEYNEQNSRCPRCGFSEEEMNGAQKLPEDILKPETVLQGRFVIGRPLSCSDYSFVYLAWDGVLRRCVAIREYFPGRLARRAGNEVVCRSGREKNLFEAGKLDFESEAMKLHYNQDIKQIVNVYRVIKENNTIYTVMEYLTGISLRDLMDMGFEQMGISEKNVLNEIFNTITAIHARGIGHYNLSPDNIYIDETGIRLLDFGKAKYKMYQATGGRVIRYEEDYIAPEVLSGKEVRMNADLYSLGILEYELYTGKAIPYSNRPQRRKKPLKTGNAEIEREINILADTDSKSRPVSLAEYLKKAGGRKKGRD